MPRDQRLYMTFPNDFPWHPKIARLSVEAKWTFVEMNGHCRLNDLDGVIPAVEAVFMWPVSVLDELCGSHPTRPLVQRVGDDYVIREYAQHQQTKAARDELTAKRAEAGRKGGKASASGKQVLSKPQQTQAESRVQSPEDYYSPSESQSLDTRAREATDPIEISETTRGMAARAGIDDLATFAALVRERTGITVNGFGAMTLATDRLKRARKYPDDPDGYLRRCVERSPAEIEQFIHENGLSA